MIDFLLNNDGMSAPAWAFLTAIGAGILGILKVVIENRKKVREDIGPKLERIEALSEPTGNGFADRMLNGQDDILRRLFRMESALMEHIEEHNRMMKENRHE